MNTEVELDDLISCAGLESSEKGLGTRIGHPAKLNPRSIAGQIWLVNQAFWIFMKFGRQRSHRSCPGKDREAGRILFVHLSFQVSE